jgi:hypothetical protein
MRPKACKHCSARSRSNRTSSSFGACSRICASSASPLTTIKRISPEMHAPIAEQRPDQLTWSSDAGSCGGRICIELSTGHPSHPRDRRAFAGFHRTGAKSAKHSIGPRQHLAQVFGKKFAPTYAVAGLNSPPFIGGNLALPYDVTCDVRC